jgi:hypothetical protein
MKTQISKKVFTYSMVTVMLLTQSASAAGGILSSLKKETEISVPNLHPCSRELQLELNQIKIMEATQNVINNDSSLRVAGNTAVAASDGQDAVSAAASGDYVSAGISLISSLIYANKAVKEGKKDIKIHFTLAEGIQERKANLKYVLDNPNVCNDSVRKAYLTNYILDTKNKNDKFLEVLNSAINKSEGSITPVLNAVALGAGVALAAGTIIAFNSKAHPLVFGVLAAGSFLGLGTGIIGYGKDYLHNIPTLNSLKAQKSQLESISNQLQEQLKSLQTN